MTLLLIGFLGGLLTGVSPCILPVLPVVLLGGVSPDEVTDAARSRARPFLVVAGLTFSFAVFTLFGTLVLSLLHLPAGLIRWLGLIVLVLLGLSMIVPPLERLLERPFSLIPQRQVRSDRGAFVFGLALGAVFVPCAGPVLAAITVAGATGRIGAGTLALTLAFAVGTAIPLLFFALSGQQLSTRLRAFRVRQRAVRVVSGGVMIALAVALTFNIADAVQRYIPNYTQSLANSLEKGASPSTGDAGGSLLACQTAAYYGGGEGLADCGRAPEFTGISQWFNTPDDRPLTLAQLKGKVVLVDFWAYSCINCQRELPHVEAWAKDYGSDGFVVVGVHTPEYSFERVPSNVEAGARRLGLTFPIAIDDSYGTWNAYANQSWPASYLIDATGKIRHVSVGEGDYGQQESNIRQLLTAAHPGMKLPPATKVADTTPRDPQQSPETYLGSERQQYYGGGGSYATGTHGYAFPSSLKPDSYGLAGTWTVGDESITSGPGAGIRLSYHASEVYLDVGGTGTLTVTNGGRTRTIAVAGAPDIYTIASASSPRDGTVTIQLSSGLQAYSFTFG
ncbi:MAG TPA: cytochrome c biogenesis protein DipZ [Candidatus Dormibacteraeota bacterium]|jgi:cytochrome c biogenesis protein CcdA/thiol-disulfide isomerase/thioredoxin|nr:cytochrome c biogenesis protein DipZ [Candidatus Dormibacteraeota bacterium]